MSIEIISVAYAQLEKSGWFLQAFVIDLDVKPITVELKSFPIKQSSLLPIGIEIQNGIVQGRTNGITKSYKDVDFQNGTIHSLINLPDKIYPFSVSNLLYEETMMYSTYIKGRKTVFFTFELFRQFIAYDSNICHYILEHDMLDIFLDKSQIMEENGKSTLFLEFNGHMKVSLAKNKEFIRNMVFLLYNEDLRRYWKEIQASTRNSKNNFTFSNIPFKKMNLKAIVRPFKDFDLVYHITSMSSFNFPFDQIEVRHPKLETTSDGSKITSTKSRNLTEEWPKELNMEDTTSPSSSNKETSITIDKPGFKFEQEIPIETVKSKNTPGKKDTVSQRIFTEFKLHDMTLSFNSSGQDGIASSVVLEDLKTDSSFDFTRVPTGLQLFCNAINILSRLVNVKFDYEIVNFPEKPSSFVTIKGDRRKAILVTFFSQPNIFLLEVDSSDNRYISTLIFKDLKVAKSDFLNTVLGEMAKRSGIWWVEYLDSICTSVTIRHPRKLAKYDLMRSDDVRKSIENRIALSLVNILQ